MAELMNDNSPCIHLGLAVPDQFQHSRSFNLHLATPSSVRRSFWEVPTGRRDGRVPLASEANRGLPSPFADITQLKAAFAAKGLSAKDLAVLSGGHTIGISRCLSFMNRLYNFTGNGDTNPKLDKNYIAQLKTKCKPGDTTSLVEMDPGSFKPLMKISTILSLKEEDYSSLTRLFLITMRQKPM
ncbi:hypothetical protein ACFX1X_024370 [Malus domestica]